MVLPKPLLVLPLALSIAVALATGGLAAQPSDPSCADGLVPDDGSFENAYGLLASAGRRAIVTRLDPAPGASVREVCLCWIRNTADADIEFDLVFYAPDGPGGEPGTLLERRAAVATRVASTPPGSFHSVDISSATVTAPAEGLFVGAEWDAAEERGFFLCADENGSESRPGYSGAPGDWRTLTASHPNYRTLAVRARLDEPGCTPSDTELCLRDGRFRVEVDWETPSGASGQGHPAGESSADSGLFWFFRDDNWELLVKVLDGCAINDHFWVFAAATTNVGYTLRVTDTTSGAHRDYPNPIGSPAEALTDTEALPCSQPR